MTPGGTSRRAPFGTTHLALIGVVVVLGACAQSSGGNSGGFGGFSGGLGGASGLGGATAGGSGGSASFDAGGTFDASADGAQASGGSSGAGQGGVSGTGGTPGCTLSLTPVTPPSFDAFEAFPGAFARVAASARGARSTPVVWAWTVNLENPAGIIATTAVDGTAGAIVAFPVQAEGRYLIAARVVGEPACGTASQIATARQSIFVLRTSAGGFPTQDKQIGLAALDPQPTTLTIQLNPGVDASVAPLRADGDGSSLASYVRVSLPASSLSIEGDTLRGPLRALLSPQMSYDLLVIPDEDYAPNLLSGTPASWPQPLQLDRGVPVTATMRVAGGGAVVDARMILRRGTLPSTVGASDAGGAMALWARAGTLAVFVAPPAGSGLARATVGANGDAGLVLDPATAALDLQLTWDAVTTAPLSVEVHAPDGATRVAGAQVRVRSHAAAAAVATLVARADRGAPVTLRASGAIDVDAVTDASGVATFPSLPLGDLDVTVVPAVDGGASGGAVTAAITSAAVTVARGGLTRVVTLARKVALTGSLLPAADSAGARVTAIDKSITAAGAVVTATVAGDGTYALSVDPARAYELLVDPAPAAARARAVLGTFMSGTGATAVGARTLPAGRLVVGTVIGAGGTISGARVQAFCPVWSSRCLDPTFSLADAVTRADGTFELRLPEPAQ
jgi:hypothetical protein